MDTKAFTPVFEGLKTFLAADGRDLVILIGNHDVEIALPGGAGGAAQEDRPDA